jgi:hypothetical protein
MTTNTGGAAFPYAAVHGCNGEYGMTLRDYFAAKALPTAIREVEEAETYDLAEVAAIAYQYAGAMLKARQA